MARIPIVDINQVFNHPADAIWPIVGPGFASIKLWIPGVRTCKLVGHQVQVGAARHIMGYHGKEVVETITEFDAENYFFEIHVAPTEPDISDLRGRLKLDVENSTTTRVHWWADAEQGTDEAISAKRTELEMLFTAALASLRKLLDT